MILDCFREPILSRLFGRTTLDIMEVVTFTGCRATMFPVIRREVEERLPSKAWEIGKTSLASKRVSNVASHRWKTLLQACDVIDPNVADAELQAARTRFRENSRDLASSIGRPKDPVPGPNDLRILLQAAACDRGTVLVTKDSHFVGYRDLIAAWYNVQVVNALELPDLLEEWRSNRG